MDFYIQFSLKWLSIYIILISAGLLSLYQTEQSAIELTTTLNSNFQDDLERANNFGKQMVNSPKVFEKALITQVNILSKQSNSIMRKTIGLAFTMAKDIFVFILKALTGTIKCLLNLFLDVGYTLTSKVLALIQTQIDAIINSIQNIVNNMESSVSALINQANSDFQGIKDVIELVIGDVSFIHSLSLLDGYNFPNIPDFLNARQISNQFTTSVIDPFLSSKPDLNLYWDTAENQVTTLFDSFLTNYENIDWNIAEFQYKSPVYTWNSSTFQSMNTTIFKDEIQLAFSRLYFSGLVIFVALILANLIGVWYSIRSQKLKIKALAGILKRDKTVVLSLEKSEDPHNLSPATSVFQYFQNPILFKISKALSAKKRSAIFQYLNIFSYKLVQFFILSFLALSMMYNASGMVRGLEVVGPLVRDNLIILSKEVENVISNELGESFDQQINLLNSQVDFYIANVEDEINSKISGPIRDFRYLIGNSTTQEINKIYDAVNFLSDQIQWPEFSVSIKGLLQCAIINKIDNFELVLSELADALELKLSTPRLEYDKDELGSIISDYFESQNNKFDLNCTVSCAPYSPNQEWDFVLYTMLKTQHGFFQNIYKSELFCAPLDTIVASCHNKFLAKEYGRFYKQVQQKVDFMHMVMTLSIIPWLILAIMVILKYSILVLLYCLKQLIRTLIFLVQCVTDSSFLQFKISQLSKKIRPIVVEMKSYRFSRALRMNTYREKYIEWKIQAWNYFDGIKIRILTYFNKL